MTTSNHDLITLFYHHGSNLLIGVIIFIIGLVVAKLAKQIANRLMCRNSVETTIRLFINQLIYTLIIIIALIAALAKAEVSIASLVAILGAAALAISLSLKDSLSNLASGILLLLFRPFKVGDDLTFNGYSGIVKSINFLFTTMEDTQQQQTIVPNSKLTDSVISNFSASPQRQFYCCIEANRDDADQLPSQLLPLFHDIHTIDNRQTLKITVAKLTASRVGFAIELVVKKTDQLITEQHLLSTLYQYDQKGTLDVTFSHTPFAS